MPLYRSGGSTEILELFEAATAALGQRTGTKAAAARSGGDEGACRAQFRLAHYADQLYRAADSHLQSPEWATRLAVVEHKREQVWQGFRAYPIWIPVLVAGYLREHLRVGFRAESKTQIS